MKKKISVYTPYKEGEYKTPEEMFTKERVNYIQLMALNRVLSTKTMVQIGLPHLAELKKNILDMRLTVDEIDELISNRAKSIAEKLYSRKNPKYFK